MRFVFLLLLNFLVSICFGQSPARPTSADIYQSIKKLNVLGSVLYVAAHPDDENQRLISYFANKELYDVTYLSLTRGDGGQNLIGPEIRELLGVLRTEELLAARNVDGGHQLFSRANDFGYSKNPTETLKIWDEDQVLADVVRAYRKVQPDVVINRFDHEYNTYTHGHHTASAMLSVEAFDKAAQANFLPEMVRDLGTWQAARQFLNVSHYHYGGEEEFAKVDKSQFYTIDVGAYLPLKRKSNTEIAAEARSQHLCQGFGTELIRGSYIDYLKHINGSKPKGNAVFEGINTTWSRLENGVPIGIALENIAKEFDLENPAASVAALLQVRKQILALKPSHWRDKKLADLEQVVFDCMGFFIEAKADAHTAVAGDSVRVDLEILNRSNLNVSLGNLTFLPSGIAVEIGQQLRLNEPLNYTRFLPVPQQLTAPYWLLEKPSLGMYRVAHDSLIGLPRTPRVLKVRGTVFIEKEPISFKRAVIFREAKPDKGERYAPFEITPPVFVEFSEKMLLITGEKATIQAKVTAGKSDVKGTLHPVLPKGWRSEPETVSFDLTLKGASKIVDFTIFPSKNAQIADISLEAEIAHNKTQQAAHPIVSSHPTGSPHRMGNSFEIYSKRQAIIDYDHVPKQTVLLPSDIRAVPLDVKIGVKRVAYLQGAGDAIPEILRLIGCDVTEISTADLTFENLKQFDALVLGVRAYNTQDVLKFAKNDLLKFVEKGGTLINQYNTNFRLVQDDFAPYPLQLSRDRVTEEDAPVRLLQPNHPILSRPNRITEADFEGWVQERGLYFPNEWSADWTPLLEMSDTNETPLQGGLLVSKYGSGYYIYTGLSFFRELPAGVSGAIRLFANLISLKDLP